MPHGRRSSHRPYELFVMRRSCRTALRRSPDERARIADKVAWNVRRDRRSMTGMKAIVHDPTSKRGLRLGEAPAPTRAEALVRVHSISLLLERDITGKAVLEVR